MARDVGGYFEKLTRKGRGGRRLEGDTEYDLPDPPSRTETATPSAPSGGSAGGGGLGDMLKDILGRGKSTATKAGKQATDRARREVDRRGKRPSARSKGSLPPEGVVSIEYSPSVDGDPDPGEVVWTWVPYEEDPDQGKDRPVVVIGRRGRNLVGVPLTTKRSEREAQISIGTGAWDPKRRTSYARIWRMLDIDENETRREGAVLERSRFDDVVKAVDEYYDVKYPASPKRAGDRGFEYDY